MKHSCPDPACRHRQKPCRAHVARLEWKGEKQVPVCDFCGGVCVRCVCIKNDEPSRFCRMCRGTGWVLLAWQRGQVETMAARRQQRSRAYTQSRSEPHQVSAPSGEPWCMKCNRPESLHKNGTCVGKV